MSKRPFDVGFYANGRKCGRNKKTSQHPFGHFLDNQSSRTCRTLRSLKPEFSGSFKQQYVFKQPCDGVTVVTAFLYPYLIGEKRFLERKLQPPTATLSLGLNQKQSTATAVRVNKTQESLWLW